MTASPNAPTPLLDNAAPPHTRDNRLLILKGRSHLLQGRLAAAHRCMTEAVGLDPGSAAAHAGMAQILFAAGELDEAFAHSQAACRLAPSPANTSFLSGIMVRRGDFGGALARADEALAAQPLHAGALLNRAAALERLGRLDEAIAAGEHALAIAPEDADAQVNLALTYLSRGQMTPRVWALFEQRLHRYRPAWPTGAQQWAGEALGGRTILLHAEQGLGDTLQFVRYAPLVAARGGRVVLAVQPALLRLLTGAPGVDELVAVGGALPRFDVFCMLMSLPGVFETDLNSIPPPQPYAHAAGPRDGPVAPLRVGLVWAGNSSLPFDRLRLDPRHRPCRAGWGWRAFSSTACKCRGRPAARRRRPCR